MRPVSRNDPTIFVPENEVMEHGMMVVALPSEIPAPVTNFDPVIVIVAEPVVYPETGEIVVIAGVGLITVNPFPLATEEPSVFRIVRLYVPIGRPVSGSEHFIVVPPVTVPAMVLFVVWFVMVTVAPARKFVPVTVIGRGAVFTPETGVKPEIVGSEPGEEIVNGFEAFGPPGLVTVRLYDPEETPVRTNDPIILVPENEVIEPGIMVVALPSEIPAPVTNFDPVIVTVTEPGVYPEAGEIVVITGVGFVTVNPFSRVTEERSAFRTVRL